MSLTVVKQRPHKATHTKSDTILVTKELIASWKPPPFQRPLRPNAKVQALAVQIKQDDGVIPGVICLGLLGGATYLLDGQHRVHSFLLSGLKEGFADVRILHCETVADMAREFVNLNSRLVNFRPDDILKGLEPSLPTLQRIRKRCPFVGYDQIRRGTSSPILSMSAALRCWTMSAPETPGGVNQGAADLAHNLTDDEADRIVEVLTLLASAWGRDIEYARLWGGLNLTICLWLYRRTVLGRYTPATTGLTKDQFSKAMMALSADSQYVEWLTGRMLGERDRSPCYGRVKTIVSRRIEAEGLVKPRMPSPPWSSYIRSPSPRGGE